jgi:hypothetical protein
MTRRWRQGEDVWIGGANRFLLRLTLRERVAMGDRNCPQCRSPSEHGSAAGHRNGSRDRLLTTPAGDHPAAHPTLPDGKLLPVAAGAPPPCGSGPVGRRDGGLRLGRLHPPTWPQASVPEVLGGRAGGGTGLRERHLSDVNQVDGRFA